MAVVVRSGTAGDAGSAAALHASEITEGFLSTLGKPFLTVLYRRVATCANAFLLIAEDGSCAVGFAAVTDDTRRFYRSFLARDGVRAGVMAAPKLLGALPHALETLRYGTGRPARHRVETTDGGEGKVSAEVLAVAVASQARGQGVGRALVGRATEELRRRGVSAARVVAGNDNVAALALYRACGFAPTAQTELHRGQLSQVLTWS